MPFFSKFFARLFTGSRRPDPVETRARNIAAIRERRRRERAIADLVVAREEAISRQHQQARDCAIIRDAARHDDHAETFQRIEDHYKAHWERIYEIAEAADLKTRAKAASQGSPPYFLFANSDVLPFRPPLPKIPARHGEEAEQIERPASPGEGQARA